eukprot:359869-Chlamydomonas_euryale.AAC.21
MVSLVIPQSGRLYTTMYYNLRLRRLFENGLEVASLAPATPEIPLSLDSPTSPVAVREEPPELLLGPPARPLAANDGAAGMGGMALRLGPPKDAACLTPAERFRGAAAADARSKAKGMPAHACGVGLAKWAHQVYQ